jgi:hypothetical protein
LSTLKKEITIITGVAAYDLLLLISEKIMKKINVKVNIEKITNNFFGEKNNCSWIDYWKRYYRTVKIEKFQSYSNSKLYVKR